MAPAQPTALAGISEDEQYAMAIKAIEILKQKDSKYGEHLHYLANISEHQYKMLLSFIK